MPPIKRLPGGITHKQRLFIKKVVAGARPMDAALEVYDAKNKNVAASIASENLGKINIREAVEQGLKDHGLSTSQLMSEIAHLATTIPEKVTADVKLRALVEAAKLLGAYPDRRTQHLNLNVNAKVKAMSFDEAKGELLRFRKQSATFIEEAE